MGGRSCVPEYPKYVGKFELKSETRTALDELESRRFVQHSAHGVEFTHPFYRAAAESMLALPSTNAVLYAIRVLERGLFSLGPQTSRAAARNLVWFFQQLQNRPDQQQVFQLAVGGLQSLFPATRDLCFSFLVNNQQVSQDHDSSRMKDWIESAMSIDLDRLEWHEGEAWVPSGELPLLYSIERRSNRIEFSEIEDDLQLLGQPNRQH